MTPLATKLPVEFDPSQNIIQTDDVKEGDMADSTFFYAAMVDKNTGTFQIDVTGVLTVYSLDIMQYYIVAYDYDTTYSFEIPI